MHGAGYTTLLLNDLMNYLLAKAFNVVEMVSLKQILLVKVRHQVLNVVTCIL